MSYIHVAWIQGESKLPPAYRENLDRWQDSFPHKKLIVWDNERASETWSDYRNLQDSCFHHATRADLILARAVRDYGGLATGTDVQLLHDGDGLIWWMCNSKSLLVINPARHELSNGLVWFPEANHPFITAVCNEQVKNPGQLASPNVAHVTGPGAYWRTLCKRSWDLQCVTDAHAYSRLWHTPSFHNPDAWVDPGYAASWQKAK